MKITKLPKNEYKVDDGHISIIEKTALKVGIKSLEQEITTKQSILDYRKSILKEINKLK